MPKKHLKKGIKISKNRAFFDRLTSKKQNNKVLLVVDGAVYFESRNLSKVIDKFSKIPDKDKKEISIIPVQRNKSAMVV